MDRLTRQMPAGAVDADGLTVVAVVATDAPVARRDARGPYLEVLDPAGADLSGIPADGLPLLDSHDQTRAGATLGRVTGLHRDGGAILATVTFSTADDVAPIRQRVADGTLRHFSIGYRVHEWSDGLQDG